jgi:hypothetical protein
MPGNFWRFLYYAGQLFEIFILCRATFGDFCIMPDNFSVRPAGLGKKWRNGTEGRAYRVPAQTQICVLNRPKRRTEGNKSEHTTRLSVRNGTLFVPSYSPAG